MELARGAVDQIAEMGGPASAGTERIDPETATTLLRRCTALATRARVDLLTPGRRSAAEDLTALLARMEASEPLLLEVPDPTMTVLAAAALQDLAERLPHEDPSALSPRIAAVLGVLRRVMAAPKVDVLA